MQNLFAGLRTGPVAWLAEADYIVDDGTDNSRRELWVGHLEADWRLRQGQKGRTVGSCSICSDDGQSTTATRFETGPTANCAQSAGFG